MEETEGPGRNVWRRLRLWGARDVIAGISVGLILIPQSLAYARVAGLPAVAGLYAAALPPLAAAFLASSPYLQTGPTAVTSLLTFGALAPLAPVGSPEYVAMGLLLALIVGIIRLVLGLFRVGNIVYLMSEPVLRGFTGGAAILIIASQLPGALGVDPRVHGVISGALAAMMDVTAWNAAAVAVAAGTLGLVLGGRRLHPLVPGVLFATVIGVAVNLGLGLPAPAVGSIPEGVPPLGIRMPWEALPALVVPGIVIALVGFAEVASLARVFAAREREVWSPDRDFVSQGTANLVAAASGGFPVGGSFSRTALNHMLGARTRWSGAVTGLTVLVFLPFTSLLQPLPIAVLSALVITAVTGMIRPGPILALWRLSRPQFFVAAATLVLTLALSPRIDQAVLLGILLSLGIHLWREWRIEIESWTEGDVLQVAPHGVLWFGSVEVLKAQILDLLARHPEARQLVLDLDRLGRIDVTATLVIEALVAEVEDAGLQCELRNIDPGTARALRAARGEEPRTEPALPAAQGPDP